MDIGDKIKCHGNLNKGCLSVVPKGCKTELYYDTIVVIVGAEFKCSAAGHRRIVERKCRAVVADVHGAFLILSTLSTATYTPTIADMCRCHTTR